MGKIKRYRTFLIMLLAAAIFNAGAFSEVLGEAVEEEKGIGEQAAYEKRYTDISDSWAESYIQEVSKAHILLGTDEIHFCPKAYMTRGEISEVIARMLQIKRGGHGSRFTDAADTYYYTSYIEALDELDIINGYPDESYRPNKEITREEMISLLLNVYEYKKGKSNTFKTEEIKEIPFKDKEQISGWALMSIKKAYCLGFIEGNEDGRLEPQRLATREEIAKVAAKVIESF